MTINSTISNLAQQILAAGFRVFIAERGTYGFYTDKDGTRVVSFASDLGGLKFSGNYVTSHPQSTGTGWGLDTDTFANMIAAHAPGWAIGSATYRHATLKDHLGRYGSSSRYAELLPDTATPTEIAARVADLL